MQNKLSKNVKALGVVSFLNDASSDMVYPLIPIFLTKTLGASLPMVGLIEGIAESTASLLKVFSGWLSDKLRRRKPLTVLGYGLSMIAKPMLAFAQAPWHVLFVRFSDRFGKGLRQAPRDALIAESTQSANLGFAYGFHKMMDTLGATIGPLIAMILLPVLNQNIRSLFLLSFVASALALSTLVIFVKEKSVSQHSATLPKLSLKILPRSYKIFLLAIAVFALGNFSDSFLFLRSQDVGISAVLIPLLYALSNMFFAAFATPMGKLADRIGPQKIIIAGYGVFALTHAGFALFASQNTVWILFPLFGIFSAMTESVQKIIAVQTSDPDLKGTMLGLMHTVTGICQLPASLAAGILWSQFGAQAPFFFGSSMAVIAALLLCAAFWSAKSQKSILPQTR
ncbi:MFS transporter [Candidatus Peregrinibacteria bacterium]|nr:MFS transporter [Candidatus Peregrinibacteria bacterium]